MLVVLMVNTDDDADGNDGSIYVASK